MEKIQKTGTEDSDDAGPQYFFIKKPLRSRRIYLYKENLATGQAHWGGGAKE